MCVDHELPAAVARTLEAYRAVVAEHGANWKESSRSLYGPLVPYLKFVRHTRLLAGPVTAALAEGRSLTEAIDGAAEGDLAAAFRDALGGRVPDGVVVLRLTPGGPQVEASGNVQPVLRGESLEHLLLVESRLDAEVLVEPFGTVPPGGCAVWEVLLGAAPGFLVVDGTPVEMPAVAREAETATLRVRSPATCRWSVLSPQGRGWFPEDALRKWDARDRAYFHAEEAILDVPAGELEVVAARGMDHEVQRTRVVLEPGGEAVVELDPAPSRDPAADGWYGGDLHLHFNFAGDQVAGPVEAALMQRGEALHMMNPLAANATTSFVYDREAFVEWLGRDLPWSAPDLVARMGTEYRNDLLGHFAAFGPLSEPSRYYAGHAESDSPADSPSNAHMCAELRRRGAVIIWAHPLTADAEDPLDVLFGGGSRSCEARELVVDAALGLVDGLDVLNHLSCTGTARIYRRLLGAGVRLAATAGTDVMLSYSRLGTYSNPPGWARVYARLDGPLSVAAFQDAVRAGRTFATNGPWLTLEAEGQGPGALLDVEPGRTVRVVATATGADRLRVHDAAGVVAEGQGRLDFAYRVDEPTYLVAEADGEPRPDDLDPRGRYAHTSPVQLNVSGRSVARAEDVRWCLEWLDRLEALIREHGKDPDRSLFDLLEQARARYRSRISP
ncbi:CehA/McbA family metallohydrolase [Actinocorallia populi]|uniref:CehA/McbA family metallohydrolase n=1 Tax=Actinocorallia populi TaxID=2079200 RepID=UPI001300785B|nr:CehA/McbA family metallohydrolase [Actinocorallia populi]